MRLKTSRALLFGGDPCSGEHWWIGYPGEGVAEDWLANLLGGKEGGRGGAHEQREERATAHSCAVLLPVAAVTVDHGP